MTAYLNDNLTPEEITVIQKKIRAFPQVKKFSFFSKEKALNLFKDNFPGQKQVLEGLQENPLPASFDIQLQSAFRQPEQVKDFASMIKKIPGVEGVEYGQSWMEGYTRFLEFVKMAALAVGVVIVLATVFIISNTIKLTLLARKDEIEILRLVGATNFFIKIPFFIEGILQGLFGAFFALATLYLCYHLFMKWIAALPYFSISVIKIFYLPSPYLAFITLGGMLTGFLGSFFSLGRYLKT